VWDVVLPELVSALQTSLWVMAIRFARLFAPISYAQKHELPSLCFQGLCAPSVQPPTIVIP
jgi:hypothetical protein